VAKKDGIVVDLALAKKLWRLVSKGLTDGIGQPEPGRMCVEAAVCYALGLKHGDDPPCVGEQVRCNKIDLNDCMWSDDKARGRGLRDVAIAQLGSNKISQKKYENVVRRLLAQRLLVPAVNAYLRSSNKLANEDRATLVGIVKKLSDVTPRTAARTINDAIALAKSTLAVYGNMYGGGSWPYRNLNGKYDPVAADLKHLAECAIRGSVACAAQAMQAMDNFMFTFKGKAKKDEWLLVAAGVILDALRECDSPGVKLLDELRTANAA